MSLYKFYSGNENSVRNLLESSFWFSNYSDYNDPFEGKFVFKRSYEYDSESYKKIVSSYKAELEESSARMDKIKELENASLFVDVIKFIFNDFRIVLEDLMEANISRKSVCCFSQGDETAGLNQLMWSHYSDGLRGFCLVFEDDENSVCRSLIDSNSLEDIYLLKVRYVDSFPTVDLEMFAHNYLKIQHYEDDEISLAMDEIYLNHMVSKSKEWEYENEYRLISEQKGIHYWPKKLLKRILIGEKMPMVNRRLIGCVLKEKYPNVEILEVSTSIDGYDLIYKRELSVDSLITT